MNGELEDKAVLKSFWSWRRVGVPKGWREALVDAEKGDSDKDKDVESGVIDGAVAKRPDFVRRRGSWWVGEGDDGRGNCVIM